MNTSNLSPTRGSLKRNIIVRFSPLLFALLISTAFAGDWPAWRGPLGTGLTEEKNLPVKWSTTENVKWRIPLPEPGNSTPIVWRDRVFLPRLSAIVARSCASVALMEN
jgi:hypothetical protein